MHSPPVVDVIVPVLDRPHAAAEFMKCAADVRVNVVAVADLMDSRTQDAWTAAGAKVLVSDHHTFAAKVNYAYRRTSAPWLLLVGDDARLGPGWLLAALDAAGGMFHVVGTNDQANRRVVSGQHSCHPLIRRSYVDEVGASWDGPGVVCHEGYRHNYVDDEIVTAAKDRHVWVFAERSIVNHLHPVFGTAVNDSTYRHGRASMNADRVLFAHRASLHGGR